MLLFVTHILPSKVLHVTTWETIPAHHTLCKVFCDLQIINYYKCVHIRILEWNYNT